MIETITQSVFAKFVDSGNTDFSGSQGMWFGQIPANLELPFFGFVHNGEAPKYTTEKGYKDLGSFLFSIYAEGVAETERLALIVLGIFDAFITNWTALNFTGGKCSEWQRARYIVSLEPIEDVNARKVGRVDITYAYTTTKVLP